MVMWSHLLALACALLLLPAQAMAGVKEKLAALAPSGLVLVLDEKGNELVAQNANKPFVPASVTKIVTAWLAMEVLGPDYRFATRFYLDRDRVLWTPCKRSTVGSTSYTWARSQKVCSQRSGLDLSLSRPGPATHLLLRSRSAMGTRLCTLKRRSQPSSPKDIWRVTCARCVVCMPSGTPFYCRPCCIIAPMSYNPSRQMLACILRPS